MSCCGLLIKVGFLSFLALNAWNILHNSDTHTTQFKTNYKSFETTVHSRLGLKLPDCINSAHLSRHAETIVKVLAWAQLLLSAATLLLSSCWAWTAGLVFFAQQALHLNLANISLKTSLTELERFALPVAILFASFAISCYDSCKAANAKCTEKTSQATDKKTPQATDKKKN